MSEHPKIDDTSNMTLMVLNMMILESCNTLKINKKRITSRAHDNSIRYLEIMIEMDESS